MFAGQRAEGFYVDLGAIFDLGDLRPFQNLHLGPRCRPRRASTRAKAKNIHTIAIQVPKTDLTAGGSYPHDPTDATSTIGVCATASRQRSRVYEADGTVVQQRAVRAGFPAGQPADQRGRHPDRREGLLVTPAARSTTRSSPTYVAHPELAGLLPVLYPDVFPNLAALNASGKPRADLLAILLTGIPSGLIPGFQNYTGPSSPTCCG